MQEAKMWPANRNRRKHHVDTLLHSGSMLVPDAIAAIAEEADIYRTTHGHRVVRFVRDNVLWLFRRVQPGCTRYVGEVVRTASGTNRVHIFRVCPPEHTHIKARLSVADHRVVIEPLPLPAESADPSLADPSLAPLVPPSFALLGGQRGSLHLESTFAEDD